MRRALIAGSIAWAMVGVAVALTPLRALNEDARLVIGAMGVLFPSCAGAAALALRQRRDRLAGGLLLLSVLTPTYYLYVLPIPALIIGLVLVTLPRALLR